MAERRTIWEYDLARVISMLAVIMIHVTAPYLGRTSDWTVWGITPAFFLNQVTRFAVPLFLLLSGASLSLSRSAATIVGFYQKRLRKIGAPYLLWFCLYYLDSLKRVQPTPVVTLRSFLRALLQGQGAPHLYFIVILVQCYLLYPLLRRAVDRSPGWTAAGSLLLTSVMQLLLALRRAGIDWIPGFLSPYLWLLFPTWAFYFVLGMTLTREKVERLQRFAKAHCWPILLGTGFFACGYVVQSKAFHALDSMKLLLNIYVPLVLLAAFALWQRIGCYGWVRKAVRFLSAHSMTVYFGHVFVLRQFETMDRFTRGMSGMLELWLLVTALSVPLAWLLDTVCAAIYSKFKESKKGT